MSTILEGDVSTILEGDVSTFHHVYSKTSFITLIIFILPHCLLVLLCVFYCLDESFHVCFTFPLLFTAFGQPEGMNTL